MSFAQKYRPVVWGEFVGQANAVATCMAQLEADLPLPLLLTGPPGVGKTSMALVLAQALNCVAPATDRSPCLACDFCLSFDTSERAYFFLELNAGRLGGKDAGAYVDEFARCPPMHDARRRVVFIDEAHALTPAAEDHVLNVLEVSGVAAFVLATSAPERVGRALRSRCIEVRFQPLPDADLIALGRRVCAAEKLPFEPEALGLLAATAQGQARDFLNRLEESAKLGPISVERVAKGLDLSWATCILEALTTLLRGDFAACQQLLATWSGSPGDKARAILDAFAFVAARHFAPQPFHGAINAAYLVAPAEAVAALGAAIVQRASVLNIPAAACAVSWGLHWVKSASEISDDAGLTLHLLSFAQRVCPPDVVLPPLPPAAAPAVLALPRRRAVVSAPARARGQNVNVRGSLLCKADVRREYRAASMLPQHYGVWFNARLVLRWRDFDVTGVRQALDLFSQLTHELGLRLRDWTGDPAFRLHWLAQHEGDRDGGLTTWLLAHLALEHAELARAWLSSQLPVPDGALLNDLGRDVWRIASPARPHITHWALMHELWRIIDPEIMEIDGLVRKPLRDLLRVPLQHPRRCFPLPPRVRRFTTSKSLGSAVWAAADHDLMGFVSALDERAWPVLRTGWERDEHDYRREEIARRRTEVETLRALFPDPMDSVDAAAFAAKLAALKAKWPRNPMRRPRPKPLW